MTDCINALFEKKCQQDEAKEGVWVLAKPHGAYDHLDVYSAAKEYYRMGIGPKCEFDKLFDFEKETPIRTTTWQKRKYERVWNIDERVIELEIASVNELDDNLEVFKTPVPGAVLNIHIQTIKNPPSDDPKYKAICYQNRAYLEAILVKNKLAESTCVFKVITNFHKRYGWSPCVFPGSYFDLEGHPSQFDIKFKK